MLNFEKKIFYSIKTYDDVTKNDKLFLNKKAVSSQNDKVFLMQIDENCYTTSFDIAILLSE